MPVRVGVLGLGSVFEKYGKLLEELGLEGRVQVSAVFDPRSEVRKAQAQRFGIADDVTSPEQLIGRDDVDTVLVLTSMNAHGPLSTAAYEAGKHVLIEKPMATSLAEAARLVELSQSSRQRMVCAPHVLLSHTYREMHRRLRAGVIGDVKLARALYGWSGPWWGQWFYQPGGGALFDLGVYNVTSLCGFLGPVRRVTALVGTAIPERVVDGELTRVEADDNAHVLLDFGSQVYGSVTTGFTIQKYGHAPAIELYGLSGSMNMLGDDWAPSGFEQWRNEAGCWESYPESDPGWPWTYGLRHLVECIERDVPAVTRPEQSYHVLEVMLAAVRSAREGRAIEITSTFPEPDYSAFPLAGPDARRQHDPS
ncbi:MAG TPA: Gfo/Idh/MocA family oxidoreductase [Streptosporangiaceae bacterium]|nr:Gfo/Idh/MocA family oxidoreductase [Streptosporangiaceae bacterium]